MISRRLAFTLAAMTALATTACAGTDPVEPSTSTTTSAAPVAAADPKAAVQLTWWTGQSADAETLLEKMAKTFTAAHPNVTIKVSSGASTTDELLQKLAAGFSAGTYPDISYAFGSWASQLGQSDKTLDVTANVADPAVKWTEFPEAARKTASPAGKTIGFPAVVDNLALFYNKTVFDRAGVSYPDETTTWDQFRDLAKKLTDPAAKTYGTAYDVSGGEGTTWVMWPQIWQEGGSILTPDAKHAAFNSEAGVKVLTRWRDMAQTDKSVYLDQTVDKAAAMFQNNTIGMVITGPWAIYDLMQTKTKYGVTSLPGVGSDHQTVSGPDLWVLFDHDDANRAYWAFEFTKWLTSAEQDVTWNVAYGNLPLRSSERAMPEFAAQAKALPGYEFLADNLANAKNERPTVKGYDPMSKAFAEQVSKILQGQADPKQGLDDAAKAADEALADQ